MAGRNTVSPLLRRITSSSWSQSRARSSSLAGFLTMLFSTRSDSITCRSFPSVVSARRSVPRLPGGRQSSRCLSSRPAASRRMRAICSSVPHARCSVTRAVSASRLRTVRLPAAPSSSPRPSKAMPRTMRNSRSGSGSARPWSRSTWAAIRRWSDELSPFPRSGAASCMCSMRAVSNAAASCRRFRDERSTPVWTNAVSAVSLLAMPNRSRSYRAPRTRSGLRPEIAIISSVLTPSSASAPISACAISRSCRRYAAAIFALASCRAASPTVLTRSEDGNTCTTFSSRVRSRDSSSQATAVRTRVSSVAESRSNTFSSSSPRISPAVATTSPAKRFFRFFRSRLRRALRIPWISSRVRRERADMPNCRSTSSGA